jgi:hypothetical protein
MIAVVKKLKPRLFPRLLKWIGRSLVEQAAATFSRLRKQCVERRANGKLPIASSHNSNRNALTSREGDGTLSAKLH